MTVTYNSLLKSGDVHKAHKIQVKQNKENKENEPASNKKKKHFDDLELNSDMVELRHDEANDNEADAQNEGVAGNNKPVLGRYQQSFVTPDADEDSYEVEDDESEECECEYGDDSDSDCSIYDEDDEELQAPFWFGYEESEQLPIIFEKYTSFLELAEEARDFPRAPPPFIARIRRIGIEACDCYDNDEDVFQTYDTVCVCYRKTVAPGTPLELARKEYVLTTWDRDGVPVCFQSLRDMSKRKTYQDRLLNGESYLFCVPFMGYDDLAVSPDKRPLTFASTATDFASVLLQQQQQQEKARNNLRNGNSNGDDDCRVAYDNDDYDWFQ